MPPKAKPIMLTITRNGVEDVVTLDEARAWRKHVRDLMAETYGDPWHAAYQDACAVEFYRRTRGTHRAQKAADLRARGLID